RPIHTEERFQLIEPLLGCVVRLKSRRSLQLGNDRTKHAVGMVGRALVAQPRIPLPVNALGESRRKSRLADAGLPRDQHDLPFPLQRGRWPTNKKPTPPPAPKKPLRPRRPHRLKTALRSR